MIAAKPAALGSTLAAQDANRISQSNEKLRVPALPKSGETANLMYTIGAGTVASGSYGVTSRKRNCCAIVGARRLATLGTPTWAAVARTAFVGKGWALLCPGLCRECCVTVGMQY